jgi:hypothetical protein
VYKWLQDIKAVLGRILSRRTGAGRMIMAISDQPSAPAVSNQDFWLTADA